MTVNLKQVIFYYYLYFETLYITINYSQYLQYLLAKK